jgi:ubiquitin carboxyl-terminal hydrolase 16/45
MVKAKNDGSSTDSCDEKDKNEGFTTSSCPHLSKSIESTKLRKSLKATGIHQNCCECEELPDGDLANDDMYEYDDTLWLCLRCGSQLCGRRRNQHALSHFNVSLLTSDDTLSSPLAPISDAAQ